MGIKLSSDTFIKKAIETSGLEDFGGRTYALGLNALVDALNNDLDLSDRTASYFQNLITQLLINRLEVAQLIKNHPEILEEKIEQPIFILGLPRSGTTLLHTLLALDPAVRYLRNFETFGAICPPPELISEHRDPRISACHEAMEGFFQMAPQLRGINGLNFMTSGTAECQNLMAHEFVHMGWSAGSSLFSHGNWVSECNMKRAYQWHKRLLQVLQWKLPNERWVLKAPIHLFGLDHLIDTYPDARIVFTHRNPFDAVASGVSMVYHWTCFSTQQADLSAIAQWYPALWAKGLRRALSIREKLEKDQFYDVYHEDFSKAPIDNIEKIYDHFGIPMSKGVKTRIGIWLRDNPRSKFGNHVCNAEKLGLIQEKETERFQFYSDSFIGLNRVSRQTQAPGQTNSR